ncbi:Heat shock protein [Dorcoceras hygrometricum]|uniref:Heat shock protein n=1 Tax=Dorcoceras hygrometricum TaxID=472368 RepID=A0A2Z7DC96_9LAMI|nr:Heat shock protein [Dorcoceras hygrometricum]
MACLGILFGCKPDSVKSYLFSVLIIIGILICLRLICHAVRLLLRKEEYEQDHGHIEGGITAR